MDHPLVLRNPELLKAKINGIFKTRGVATGEGGRVQVAMAPPLQFLNQTRSNSFSFKYQGYFFLRVFRNYTDHKFHDFYRECYNFWTIYRGIS